MTAYLDPSQHPRCQICGAKFKRFQCESRPKWLKRKNCSADCGNEAKRRRYAEKGEMNVGTDPQHKT